VFFNDPIKLNNPIDDGPKTRYSMLCHLIQLRKLLSQKSEHKRVDDRVRDNRDLRSLTRHHRPGGDREKHTGAESHEQRRRREKVCLCKNQTHSFRDE